MDWEIIGIIVGVFALVVAVKTYNRQFNIEPTAERENLKMHFMMTQKLATEVLAQLEDKIQSGYGDAFLPGLPITLAKYYEIAKSEFDSCLNDKLLENLDTFNIHQIDSAKQSLQVQFQSLQDVSNYLKMV
jgi:hypothetical protein